MSGPARILTVLSISGVFVAAFLGLVLGHSLPRNPHPSRDEQCEPLATEKDPSAVVLEPQNTWSNWGYFVAGLLILYRSRNLIGAFVGINLQFEFLFSGLYHSKLTDEHYLFNTQFLDVAWIYVLVLSLTVCAVQCVVIRLHDPAQQTEQPVLRNKYFLIALAVAGGTIFVGLMIRVIRPSSTVTTILLAASLALVTWFKYLQKWLHGFIRWIQLPRLLRDWGPIETVDAILMLAFGGVALICRFSDGTNPPFFNLCSRDEGTIQPHAIWHATSALLVLATYDFFGHYFPEQGRIFTDWRENLIFNRGAQ